jgi:hypothetical protein
MWYVFLLQSCLWIISIIDDLNETKLGQYIQIIDWYKRNCCDRF